MCSPWTPSSTAPRSWGRASCPAIAAWSWCWRAWPMWSGCSPRDTVLHQRPGQHLQGIRPGRLPAHRAGERVTGHLGRPLCHGRGHGLGQDEAPRLARVVRPTHRGVGRCVRSVGLRVCLGD
uniref:Uncharacterized protein n=1 Tax=uncultured marine virus TaxID=186617 RepID=A0A0F7L5Q9_9VIRU|nr:hypothetical protein [uncultured marine virus]